MIEVLSAPDHVVALRMSGTLTADDYDQAVSEVEAKLGRYENIGLFVDMTGGPKLKSLDAQSTDLEHRP